MPLSKNPDRPVYRDDIEDQMPSPHLDSAFEAFDPEYYDRMFALWYRSLYPLLLPRVSAILTPSNYSKERLHSSSST